MFFPFKLPRLIKGLMQRLYWNHISNQLKARGEKSDTLRAAMRMDAIRNSQTHRRLFLFRKRTRWWMPATEDGMYSIMSYTHLFLFSLEFLCFTKERKLRRKIVKLDWNAIIFYHAFIVSSPPSFGVPFMGGGAAKRNLRGASPLAPHCTYGLASS